jgi:hypothetical protein
VREKQLSWAIIGLIGLGVLLWLINWWAGRPLFIDEANVVRNLHDRSFADLFSPLDHRQYAPPLYLVLAKACGALFGYGERSLRLPALLGGAMTIYGLMVGGRALKLGWWILLPLGLLFVNPTVLRFIGEVKPYALDLGVAAMLLGFGLRGARPDWRWAVGGVLAVWLSLPAIFVLAALGLYNFLCTGDRARLKWLPIGATWLTSFALLYFLVLQDSVGSKYLNTYHNDFFFPTPGSEGFWKQSGSLLISLPKLAFGFTTISIIVGLFMSAAIVLPRKELTHGWLLLPTLLVIIASAFGFYSLIPRLLLFTLPGWWLLAALRSKQLSGRFSPTVGYIVLLLWLLVLAGTNVLRYYTSPQTFSDSRRLVRELKPGYTPILHHSVVPAYDYYFRIHPGHPEGIPSKEEGNIKDANFPGKYVLLYDVLTQGNIRESMQQDSIWAAERGCKVRTEAMFRAKAVYVDCK